MPVTELALLRLKEGQEWTSPKVLDGLRTAKAILDRVTGSKYHFLRCVENPETCYMHGGWPTIEAHMKFVPSEENKELQAAIKNLVTPEWAFHLDIDQAKTPLPLSKIVALGRWFPKEGKTDEVEAVFNASIQTLESGVGGADKITRGRRLDKGYDPSTQGEPKPEYVLLTGWESVKAHEDVAKTLADSEAITQLQTLVNGGEFLHTALLI